MKSPLTRSMISWESLCSVAAQLTIIATIPFIYYEYPVIYARLTGEDNWGEFATFVAFVVASLLFAALFTFSNSRRRNWWFLALGLGTFLIAMEEISWGQRLFGIPTPDLFQNHNQQSEINFHNLLDSGLKSIFVVMSLGWFIYGVLLPTLCAVNPPLDRLVKRLNLPLPTLSLIPLFVAPAFFLLFLELAFYREIVELFMGFSLMAFAVEQFFSQFRLVNRINSNRWLEVIIILVCLLGSFLTAMVLTSFVKTSNGMFHQDLHIMAKVILPDEGRYKQALAIFSFMEKNPSVTRKGLLIDKAHLLRKLGRREEALEVLKQALDLELKLRATRPEDYYVLRRLAKIYLGLGDEFKSRKYRDEALDILDQKINNLESEKEDFKARSSRPAWTYLIWGLKGDNRNGKPRLTLKRGQVYAELGEYPQAINEYLKAAKYEPSAGALRKQIRRRIGKVLSLCAGETGARHVTWQDIEQFSQLLSPNGLAPNWCSAFGAISTEQVT